MPKLSRDQFAGLLLLTAGTAASPATPALAADVAPPAVNEFQRAFFDDATFTFHLRNYLLDRYDSTGNDPAAWALGGWLGYETGWLGEILKFGVVGYTSQPLWAPEDRDGTTLLKPDQEGYSVLGQAYAALKFEEQVLTLYRQTVNQPEVNLQDNRMTPNTFEGGSLKGDIGPLSYYAGMLTTMKKRNSDEFVNIAEAASEGINEDSYMYLGGLEFSPIEELKARTSLYVVPDLLASSYSDAVWNHDLTEETRLRLSGQFMFQSGIGDERLTEPDYDGWIGGIKGDVIYNGLTLTAGYTFANDFSGTEDGWQAPYGSWPGYTSMIVKDFNRTEEQALLLGASFDFEQVGLEGLVFTAAAAFDLAVGENSKGEDLPEWNEYDFTADYRFTSLSENVEWDWLTPLWLRARYARVDTENPDNTRDQLDDFRIIVNYELQFKGSDL
ncbi:OprD family outer membrane porin [Aestuariivirga sp.]|uniref:OprD family outer membrane porin n=1 Tax=Aestuariivirga sp. TaxID=2650926 RepID=UPI00391B49BD